MYLAATVLTHAIDQENKFSSSCFLAGNDLPKDYVSSQLYTYHVGHFIYNRTHKFQVLGDKWRVDEVKTIIVIIIKY